MAKPSAQDLSRRERQIMDIVYRRDRVTVAVRARLELLAPHREACRRLMSFLALPPNAGLAASSTWKTVNAMWYAAGDTSTDFNFYTKRALLASVYASTVLYWLGDESEGAKLRDRMLQGEDVPADEIYDFLNDQDSLIAGDPATCRRKMKRYEEIGIARLLCFQQVGHLGHDQVMKSIRLIGHLISEFDRDD